MEKAEVRFVREIARYGITNHKSDKMLENIWE